MQSQYRALHYSASRGKNSGRRQIAVTSGRLTLSFLEKKIDAAASWRQHNYRQSIGR